MMTLLLNIKTFILTLTLLIGLSLTVSAQSYSTDKLDLGLKDVVCWNYKDASTIINAGILSIELKEKMDYIYMINDSLQYRTDLIQSNYNTCRTTLAISESKNIDFMNIIANKDRELELAYKKEKISKILIISGTILAITICIVK